jgi:plastocyanin
MLEPAMPTRSLTLILPLCAVLAIACGSDSGLGPKSVTAKSDTLPALVVTTIAMAPDSFALMQGDEYALTIDAWDQFGAKLTDTLQNRWVDKATIVSSDSGIARVSRGGRVTAVTPGLVRVTASLTVGGRTVTDSVTTKVNPATAMSARLTWSPDGGWSPGTVSVKAGATVTWVIPDSVKADPIWLNVWDDNPEKLDFVDGIATHTFPTPGDYFYGTGGDAWLAEGGRIQVF